MKRFVLSLLSLFAFSPGVSAQQLPNGGLENWTSNPLRGNVPQGWLTADDLIGAAFGITVPTATTLRSTDRRSGNFAARLETKTVALLQNALVPGGLIIGSKINLGRGQHGGVPFSTRPANMEFYYRLSGVNLDQDSAYVNVILTRTVNGVIEPLASGELYLKQAQAASAFTRTTVPLLYGSSAAPDSIRIFFTSGAGETLNPGTAFIIDDVAMTGTATATRDNKSTVLSVYPNPSTGGLFTIDARQEPALLKASLTVTDITGRQVFAQAAPAGPSPTRTVDLRGQPSGIYTLRLTSRQGTSIRRLVVR
ncbi:T9SS type A sorting domain-containing protein [Hymenobacter sp. B81]|uniref:T9SS type A sorting domain-containing protein n=1 Tax=Hymenobacter sp. B81 TaxID=3344878 RepID=UPI0037DBF4C2